MRLLGLFALVVVLACKDAEPATLVLEIDSLVLNGPGEVAFPAHVVTKSGESVDGAPITATAHDAAVVLLTDSTLRCVNKGDALVTLAAGPLRKELSVRCRPVMAFSPFTIMEVPLGSPPQDIPVVGYDSAGKQVEELSFSARVRDTSIVEVDSRGRVVAKSLGQTRIDLDFVGKESVVTAKVIQLVSLDTLRLAEGEFASWELGQGPSRYRLGVQGIGSGAIEGSFEFVSDHANCATAMSDRSTLHCVVYAGDRGTVMVRALKLVAMVVRLDRMRADL